jgi:signal transduction histidine kinase
MAFLGYWFHRNKRKLEGQLATERINYQQELLRATVLAQEEERKRIAKELHDGVGQQLTALKMRWQSICDELERIREQKNDDFSAITSLMNNTSEDVREISHRMMPRTLGEKGLVESVSDMLNALLGKTDIQVEFEYFNADKRYPEEIEVSAYRVIQELVNNVVKHSRATQVSIQIMENREKLVIIVEDNGVGFDPENQAGGIGLLNMRSRVNALDGELNFEPSPTSGTIAMARIPISLSKTA